MNLFEYTYCGNYNRQIQNLARIVPEKWSFGGNDDNGILKGYLEHTFQRVYEEEKLLETEEYAIFNTGLFNMYYQPVYAYFIPNLVPDRQRWFLDGFYTEYHLLKSGIVNLPKRAAYVTDPAELIFDTGLDIVPQYEHIFEETENCQRLPETIRGSVMKVQLFDGALRQTKRMLEADYRTAIPQYYNHGIQFLIPVCLQNPDRADLALACVKTEDGSKYLGRTCLTLKWHIIMQDCWQKSTAAGFIREEMIAAIESDTGKTCNLSLSVASDNKPSLKISCTENLVTVRKKIRIS